MNTRCYTYKGVYIPQCIGGAWCGRDYCHCPPRNTADEIERLKKRIAKLEKLLTSEVA